MKNNIELIAFKIADKDDVMENTASQAELSFNRLKCFSSIHVWKYEFHYQHTVK